MISRRPCRASRGLSCLALAVAGTLAAGAARGEVVLVAGPSAIASFDLTTGRSGIFATMPPDQGHSPRGLVVAPDGSVFIGNLNGNERVYRITPGPGDFVYREFAGPFPRFGPGHLAIDPGGRLVVASDDDGRVFRYDLATGELVDAFSSGTGNVLGLALDGNTLYISEIFQGTIQRFDLSRVPAQGADFINDSNRLERIFGLTVGHANNLLVADTMQPVIFEYSLTTGQWLRNFIDLAAVGLGSAQDIHYSPESRAYLVPNGSGVYQFDTAGRFVRLLSHPELSGAKVVTPAGNALLPPMHFTLDTPGVPSDSGAQSVAGEFGVDGPPAGTALAYAFDHTQEVTLLPFGSSWRYHDLGQEPHPSWELSGHDDRLWQSGAAPLGYGDPFIETEISYGPSEGNKFTTAYFRSEFQYERSAPVIAARVRLHRDDAAVVYLNGQELFRSNLPGGTIGYSTQALEASDGFVVHEFSAARLRSGTNLVAAEVHQSAGNSSDLTFDLEVELVYEQRYHNDLFEIVGDSLVLAADLTPEVTLASDELTAKVRVTDPVGRSLTGLFSIPLTNGAPSPGDLSVRVSAGPPTEMGVAKILRGAADPDGDAVEVVGAGPASAQGGTVSLNGGVVTYTPPPGFVGPDEFEVLLSDGSVTVSAVVSVAVEVVTGAVVRNPARVRSLPGGGVEVAFFGVPGLAYGVERTENLLDWAQIATAVADARGRVTVQDPDPPAPTAIYRLAFPAR